jgi:hypothetical protein
VCVSSVHTCVCPLCIRGHAHIRECVLGAYVCTEDKHMCASCACVLYAYACMCVPCVKSCVCVCVVLCMCVCIVCVCACVPCVKSAYSVKRDLV